MTYENLPENVCAALRAISDGFLTYDVDVANMALRIAFDGENYEVPVTEAQRYVEAWRKSGVWALKGT